MGLLDALLGRRKLKAPAPDRLFAISTAYVTFETELEIKTRGVAGIVFKALDTSDFDQIVKDWVQNGGDQIRQEYQQAMAAA